MRVFVWLVNVLESVMSFFFVIVDTLSCILVCDVIALVLTRTVPAQCGSGYRVIIFCVIWLNV